MAQDQTVWAISSGRAMLQGDVRIKGQKREGVLGDDPELGKLLQVRPARVVVLRTSFAPGLRTAPLWHTSVCHRQHRLLLCAWVT